MIEKICLALEIKPYMLFVDESGIDTAAPPYAIPAPVKKELIRKLETAVRKVVRKQ
jgi:hypothetical protein